MAWYITNLLGWKSEPGYYDKIYEQRIKEIQICPELIKKDKMNQLEKLPDKWCLKLTTEEINNAVNSINLWKDEGRKLYWANNSTYKSQYIGSDGSYGSLKTLGYTEITFEDFNRLVLNKIMEKQVKLSLEVAQKMYKSGDDAMIAFALENYTKDELEPKKEVKSWFELPHASGFYIQDNSRVADVYNRSIIPTNINIFKTEKQAKSSLAFAQLTQLMDLEEQISDEEWGSGAIDKRCICRYQNRITTDCLTHSWHFLAFKTVKARDKFLSNHEQLIREYFMLD